MTRAERRGPGCVGIAATAVLACLHLSCGVLRSRVEAMPAVPQGPARDAIISIDGQPYLLALCNSGDREYFLGVDLADRAGQVMLRLLVDPMDGPRLRVARASGGSFALGPGSCRQLDAVVQPTGWRVNRVRDFTGSLEAECTSTSGLDVRAHVRFTHCH